MTAPFEGPRLKLVRARRHADELKAEIATYLRGDPWVLCLERYNKTGQHRVSLRSRGVEIPPQLAAIFGDVVHNLRVALDLLANDLVALSGVTPHKIYFPFADSEAGLEVQIRQKMKGARADILDMIRALKPYRGGNELLRALHDLDIADKHIGVIRAASVGVVYPPMVQVPSENPGQLRYEADWTRLPHAPVDTTGFDLGGDDITIVGRVLGDHAGLCVGDNFPLAGKPLLEAVGKLGKLVQGIVQTFEAHCIGSKQLTPQGR